MQWNPLVIGIISYIVFQKKSNILQRTQFSVTQGPEKRNELALKFPVYIGEEWCLGYLPSCLWLCKALHVSGFIDGGNDKGANEV